MPKPPIRRIPADTCTVNIGSEEYTAHEGEWVEVVGSPTIAEQREVQAMRAYANETGEMREAATKKNGSLTDAESRALQNRSDEFDRRFFWLCARLGQVVVAWSLTDDAGNPLPQPDGTDAPIHALRTEEAYWLWRAYSGLFEADRKNALNGSGSSSTAKVRNRSRR